jgi:hypothetical protein
MSDDDTCTTRDCSDCKRKNVPIGEFGDYKTCNTCRESAKTRKRDDENSNRKFNYKTLYNSYKSNDPEFNLTLDEFVDMATSKCTYCGHRDLSKGYNGVDRVDSSMAHIQGNCVACCWTCNRMKSDMDVHEWIRHMARIVDHCKKNNHFQ